MKKAVIFCDSSQARTCLYPNMGRLIEIGWPEVQVTYVYNSFEAKKMGPDDADVFFVHSESFADILLDERFYGKVVNRLNMGYDESELVPDQYKFK